jgi:hypothetical protein
MNSNKPYFQPDFSYKTTSEVGDVLPKHRVGGSRLNPVNGRKSDHQTVFVGTHCRAFLQITAGNISHDTPCRGAQLNSVFIKFNIVPPKPIYARKEPIYARKKPIYARKKPVYARKKPIYACKKR